MNREALWSLFEKTGNIGAYVLYHRDGAGGAINDREAAAHASEDRRTDHQGSECR